MIFVNMFESLILHQGHSLIGRRTQDIFNTDMLIL